MVLTSFPRDIAPLHRASDHRIVENGASEYILSNRCVLLSLQLKALEKIRLHHPFDDEEIHQMCDMPVELIDHLSNRVRKMAHNMTPGEWKWNGLNVYLVDGFVA